MNEYETIRGEAERLKIGYETVRRRVKEWAALGPPSGAIISDGRLVRIRHEDFCKYLNQRGGRMT